MKKLSHRQIRERLAWCKKLNLVKLGILPDRYKDWDFEYRSESMTWEITNNVDTGRFLLTDHLRYIFAKLYKFWKIVESKIPLDKVNWRATMAEGNILIVVLCKDFKIRLHPRRLGKWTNAESVYIAEIHGTQDLKFHLKERQHKQRMLGIVKSLEKRYFKGTTCYHQIVTLKREIAKLT